MDGNIQQAVKVVVEAGAGLAARWSHTIGSMNGGISSRMPRMPSIHVAIQLSILLLHNFESLLTSSFCSHDAVHLIMAIMVYDQNLTE